LIGKVIRNVQYINCATILTKLEKELYTQLSIQLKHATIYSYLSPFAGV